MNRNPQELMAEPNTNRRTVRLMHSDVGEESLLADKFLQLVGSDKIQQRDAVARNQLARKKIPGNESQGCIDDQVILPLSKSIVKGGQRATELCTDSTIRGPSERARGTTQTRTGKWLLARKRRRQHARFEIGEADIADERDCIATPILYRRVV